jgi:hypothetical protein
MIAGNLAFNSVTDITTPEQLMVFSEIQNPVPQKHTPWNKGKLIGQKLQPGCLLGL